MTEQTLTVPLRDAAALLGISDDTAYRLHARGEFPVPVVAIGRQLFVSRRRLEQFVDGEEVAS